MHSVVSTSQKLILTNQNGRSAPCKGTVGAPRDAPAKDDRPGHIAGCIRLYNQRHHRTSRACGQRDQDRVLNEAESSKGTVPPAWVADALLEVWS